MQLAFSIFHEVIFIFSFIYDKIKATKKATPEKSLFSKYKIRRVTLDFWRCRLPTQQSKYYVLRL